MKRWIHTPIAALTLAAVFAIPLRAQQPVPLKGTFQGQESHPVVLLDPTKVPLVGSATGNGTQAFSLKREVTGDLTTFTDAGWAEWKAANGDTIHTAVLGYAELPADMPGFVRFTEMHTITGGTGRFTGAQGTFGVVVFHELEASGVANGIETHVMFGSFHGPITSPGASH
jgi:hypothetical protein